MAGLLERRVDEVMTRGPRTIATTALASEALGMMNAMKITTLFCHRPRGAGAAGGDPARARLPPRRRGLSHAGRAGAVFAGGGGPEGRAAAGGGRAPGLALPGADRRPAGRERRLLARGRRGARERARGSTTRPSPERRAATTASASPPTLVVPDAAPPTRARITTLDGTLDLHDGPVVTVSAKAGDLDIPTQRLDLTGRSSSPPRTATACVTDKATIDLRAGAFVAGDKVVSTGPLGRDHLGQPARRPGSGDRRGATVLFRRRRAAGIRSRGPRVRPG